MATLVEDLLAATPTSEPEEVKFIRRHGHRSLCNCVRRFRGRYVVTARICTCREFLENHRLYMEERARAAALPSLREQGVLAERERLRPLLESIESALSRVVFDSDMKHNRWKLWDGCAGALDILRAELGKE